MATIGTGWTANVPFTIPSTVYSASLQGGAAVIADATNKGCKAPTAAANAGFMGIIANQQPSTGTTSGDRVDLQTQGVAICLLDAGQSVTFGGQVVISDTDGSLKAYDNSTMDDCSIVGISLATMTAGSNNDPFPVLLQSYTVRKDNS